MKRVQLGGYLKWAGRSWSASKQVLLCCCRQSSPTGGCRPGKQQFCWGFFCRSYSIILASREPALIHSFLLWVKEESQKDKRTRGCFDKRHMGCLGGESCRKMLGALIRPHPSQSLSVKETFPVLLCIYHLPSFSLGFYRSAFRRSDSRLDKNKKRLVSWTSSYVMSLEMPIWYLT